MQDIDIIGFGDQGKYRIPGRQTPIFELSGETVGITAAELVLERLNGGADTQPMVRRIKAELRLVDGARA